MDNKVLTLRKELKLSQEKFGERLGVTGSGISKIESGQRDLTEQMIKAICREFNVNEEWLRTGEGEMFEEVSLNNAIIDMAAAVVRKNENSFKRDLLYALSQLTEDQWEQLNGIVDSMVDNIKNKQNEEA